MKLLDTNLSNHPLREVGHCELQLLVSATRLHPPQHYHLPTLLLHPHSLLPRYRYSHILQAYQTSRHRLHFPLRYLQQVLVLLAFSLSSTV